MTSNKISEAFKHFNNLQILIIGDVMIDSYLWGKVDRISPEAPVPIIAIQKSENRMGGAANVGLNIRALGAKPILCAMIGDDENGAVFNTLLEKRGMSKEGIITSSDRKTTVKTRIISNNQHLLRVDDETTQPLSTKQEAEFLQHIDSLFNNKMFDAVIFEDYDKGNITPLIIQEVVKKANQKNIPTLVDPKKRNFEEYKGVTLFKPNYKEICEGLKIDIPKGNFKELHKATKLLKQKLGAKYIMVTLSELGIFISNSDSYHQLPAEIRDIADVSGAGDTVVGVAACCLAAGLDTKTVAALSNLAGGLVCEKIGVVPIDKVLLQKESISYYQSL